MWFSRRSRDARPVGLGDQTTQGRPVVDTGDGGEKTLHDFGIRIGQPGGNVGREDTLQHQEAKGLMSALAALPPAQEIVRYVIGRSPVGKRLQQGTPGRVAVAVRHRKVGDRLAEVVTQPASPAARRQRGSSSRRSPGLRSSAKIMP
jgi:hypothetical protein